MSYLDTVGISYVEDIIKRKEYLITKLNKEYPVSELDELISRSNHLNSILPNICSKLYES